MTIGTQLASGHRGLRAQILLEIKKAQPITAKQLAVHFGVSANSIRRDLKEPEKKMSRAMEKAGETIRKVALKGKESVLVEKLNVSERKRLELARALNQDPEILLLDEVMAGLTPREIEDIMAVIQEVNRGGTTIMVIEHVMKAIMGISKRIIVLHHGQKIAEGTPGEITENRQVIAAYLGERYSKRLEEGSRA